MNNTSRPACNQAVADEIIRSDLLTFADRCMRELEGGEGIRRNWHHDVIVDALVAVLAGDCRRLLINIPPRYLKSFLCSVVLPAWILGHNPRAQIICVSYAQDLSEKFGRNCRQVMSSPWFERLFPKTRLNPRRNTASELETTAGGCRLATSTGGVLTGRGADYIIIDDPLKASDAHSEAQRDTLNDWYTQTLLSRLNNKATGAIVVVQQRLHEADLSGKLLASGAFRHICLRAIAEHDESFSVTTLIGAKVVGRKKGDALDPHRELITILERMKQELGENVFAAQYQQDPLPAGGAIIKMDWLRYYDDSELPANFNSVFQSWDTANKLTDNSDYSACTTWGVFERRLYLLHVFRMRLDFPTLRAKVVEHRETFSAAYVLIEDKASGTQLLQELQRLNAFWAKPVTPVGDKRMRMHGQSVCFENGQVRLRKQAAWLPEYARELLGFPNATHDDQVDSTSQALAHFNQTTAMPGIIAYQQLRLDRIRAERNGINPM